MTATDTLVARELPGHQPATGHRAPATGRRSVARWLPGRWLLPLAGLATVVASWHLATATGVLTPDVVPTPAATFQGLLDLAATSSFWVALGFTLRAWATGLLVAASIALPLGVVLGLSDRAYRFVRLPLEALRPIPPIVILPLALLTLGGGLLFQATLVVQGALWPLLITVTYAIREADPVALDTARSFRFPPWRTLFQVRLPAAAPMLSSGMRLAAATAFAVTIVSELLGGAKGLGTLLMVAQSGGDVVTVYAVTLVAGLVGLAIAAGFGAVERRLLAWQPATP